MKICDDYGISTISTIGKLMLTLSVISQHNNPRCDDLSLSYSHGNNCENKASDEAKGILSMIKGIAKAINGSSPT